MNRIARTIGLVTLLISLVFISSGVSTGCSGGGSDAGDDKTPTTGISKGGNCTTDDQCDGELKCIETKCAKVLAEGGACSVDGDCDADYQCIDEKCLKIDATVAKGGDCSKDEDCETNLKCVESKCTEVSESGASKGDTCTKDDDCAEGLKCFGGKCGELLAEGGACSVDGDCEKDYKCAEGKCLKVDFGDEGGGPTGNLPSPTIKDAKDQQLVDGGLNVKIDSFVFEFSEDMNDSTVTTTGNIKLSCNQVVLNTSWEITKSKRKYKMTVTDATKYAFSDCSLIITTAVKTETGLNLDKDYELKFKSACSASDEFNTNTIAYDKGVGCWFLQSEGGDYTNIIMVNDGQLKFVGNETNIMTGIGKPLTSGAATIKMKINNVVDFESVKGESESVDVVGIGVSTFSTGGDSNMVALLYIPGKNTEQCEIRQFLREDSIDTEKSFKKIDCNNPSSSKIIKIEKTKNDFFSTENYDFYLDTDGDDADYGLILKYGNDGGIVPLIDDNEKFLINIIFGSDSSNVKINIDSVTVDGDVDFFLMENEDGEPQK